MKLSENQKSQISQEIVDNILFNINYRIEISGSSFFETKSINDDLYSEWNDNVQRIFEEYQYHVTTDIYEDFGNGHFEEEDLDNYYNNDDEN